MRIVGLSCGRRMGNNELMLRTALRRAKEVSGADLELIRLQDLEIKDCIGCETCMRGLTTGGDGKCVLRGDDMVWLAETIKEADAIILASPIYDLIPTGTVMTMLNRALGIGKEYMGYCRQNPKICAALSLGGSDWINLTEPLMDLTVRNLSKGCKIVDKYVVGENPAPSMVVLDEAIMERAGLLGERVGKALLDKENASFMGDSGICPVCHCNLLEYRGGLRVSCPLCDAGGDVTVEGGTMKILWDEAKVAANRFGPQGDVIHRAQIAASHKRAAENRDKIKALADKYAEFDGKLLKPRA